MRLSDYILTILKTIALYFKYRDMVATTDFVMAAKEVPWGLVVSMKIPGTSITHVRIRKGQTLVDAVKGRSLNYCFEKPYLDLAVRDGLLASRRAIRNGFKYHPKTAPYEPHSAVPKDYKWEDKVRYPRALRLNEDDQVLMGECVTKEPIDHVLTRVKRELLELHAAGMMEGFTDPRIHSTRT
jgi:hypothetical protein